MALVRVECRGCREPMLALPGAWLCDSCAGVRYTDRCCVSDPTVVSTLQYEGELMDELEPDQPDHSEELEPWGQPALEGETMDDGDASQDLAREHYMLFAELATGQTY